MDPPFVCLPKLLFKTFFFLSILFYFTTANEQFSACKPFSCGSFTNLSFPLWVDSLPAYCGHPKFKLHCDEHNNVTINIKSQNFRVIHVSSSATTLRIARMDLWGTKCPKQFTNTTLDYSFFEYTLSDENSALLYDCDTTSTNSTVNSSTAVRFDCPLHGIPREAYFMGTENWTKSDLRCKTSIIVPVLGVALRSFVQPSDIIDQGFEVKWKVKEQGWCDDCRISGGRCGYDVSSDEFRCFCPKVDCFTDPLEAPAPAPFLDLWPPYSSGSSEDNSWSWKTKLIIGLTSGAIATVLLCITLFCCSIKSLRTGLVPCEKPSKSLFWCKHVLRQKTKFWKRSEVDQNIEDCLKNHGPLALTRYKYAEIKKMTKSFEVKLGQGGYGTVYKGRLLNGCPVAVKILTTSKENGQEFINEVLSISRTSHVNVVTLLGFCLERRKKALIYEFMVNGSLEKFIYNKEHTTNFSLTWDTLYQIAIGTARGLEYLHRGCNTRILHFDIKPHNILLDEHFCPKISDFGFAKFCRKKESIVSISEVRGTIGYLAPEVWNRNIGGVSHKSDVYSYGMMLLDMVGGRKNKNVEANCTTKYFPDWIYDKLEGGNNFGDDETITCEETDIAKKMTMVCLWCIQTFPTQRPTISKVIEMLEGSLDSLEMPPKPAMASPSIREIESSISSDSLEMHCVRCL